MLASCKHCYAEMMALRPHAMRAPGYARGFPLTLHEERFDQPLGRRKPTIYCTCSMADLFHEGGAGRLHRQGAGDDPPDDQRGRVLPLF
ncbi:MAG: DUF5131 family protein [Candidatus Competibacter sp.]|nr:DUF5131 family protein [Candidatus Competibacter sp.]